MSRGLRLRPCCLLKPSSVLSKGSAADCSAAYMLTWQNSPTLKSATQTLRLARTTFFRIDIYNLKGFDTS